VIRHKLASALMALVAGVMLQPSAGAQQSAPQSLETVIRSQSNLVLVDAVVTQKHDHPVLNLKQSDFRLYQDGEEQPITSFSVPVENASNHRARRYVLFYFDATTVSLSEQKLAGEAAVRFVKQAKQPNLFMAAEEYSGVARLMQNFTSDRELMAKAVANFKFLQAVAPYGEAEAQSFLFTLTDVCRSLGQIPGRKALVLLSGGFPMSHLYQDQLETTIQAANRANVTIYPIDTRALGVGSQAEVSSGAPDMRASPNMTSLNDMLKNRPIPPSKSSDTPGLGNSASKNVMGEEVLDTLAESTGGFTILNSNDYFRALSKVAEDLNDNYTLGFIPPANKQGERYHRIEVKVQGQGLKVRAREGYYETQPRDLLAGRPIGNTLLKEATGSEPGTIPVSMSAPYFYLGSQQARVNVALEFPGKALRLDKASGGFNYQLNVLGIVLRPDGSVAKRFSEGTSGSVDKDKVQKFAEQPFDYRSSFEIAPGPYRLVMVLSAGGEEFGKAAASLDITPYDEHSLGLSGIALSNQLQPVSPLLASLKGQILEEEGTLVAGGYQVLTSPTRAFPARGTAAFYVQVYEPALLGAHPPKVGIRCEITDLKSQASVYESGIMVINSQAEAGSSVIPVAFKLPMEKLSPGAYRLSVIAQDSNGGASPLRQEDFSIE
jgi:VWFA-related protein